MTEEQNKVRTIIGERRAESARVKETKMSSRNIERAKEVLESLIQGNDPVTGQELPADAVVNRIEVNRALLVAITAVNQQVQRAARRAQLPSGVGRTWSMDEETTLTAEFKRGDPVAEIATRHHRTVRAIEARLTHLGLIKPDQWTTYNAFASAVTAKKGKRKK